MPHRGQGRDAGTGYPEDLDDATPQLQLHYVQATEADRNPISDPVYTLVLHIPDNNGFHRSVVPRECRRCVAHGTSGL
jgi:hypothetical protein